MALYDQPNLSGGIDTVLGDVAQSVAIFPIMILFFVFFVILLGGSSNQKRRIGSADYPFWTILASTSVTFLALIFTIGEGIIDITTFGIIIAINILSAVWFFLSSVRGEI